LVRTLASEDLLACAGNVIRLRTFMFKQDLRWLGEGIETP
jgi:hypothetical protein